MANLKTNLFILFCSFLQDSYAGYKKPKEMKSHDTRARRINLYKNKKQKNPLNSFKREDLSEEREGSGYIPNNENSAQFESKFETRKTLKENNEESKQNTEEAKEEFEIIHNPNSEEMKNEKDYTSWVSSPMIGSSIDNASFDTPDNSQKTKETKESSSTTITNQSIQELEEKFNKLKGEIRNEYLNRLVARIIFNVRSDLCTEWELIYQVLNHLRSFNVIQYAGERLLKKVGIIKKENKEDMGDNENISFDYSVYEDLEGKTLINRIYEEVDFYIQKIQERKLDAVSATIIEQSLYDFILNVLRTNKRNFRDMRKKLVNCSTGKFSDDLKEKYLKSIDKGRSKWVQEKIDIKENLFKRFLFKKEEDEIEEKIKNLKENINGNEGQKIFKELGEQINDMIKRSSDELGGN